MLLERSTYTRATLTECFEGRSLPPLHHLEPEPECNLQYSGNCNRLCRYEDRGQGRVEEVGRCIVRLHHSKRMESDNRQSPELQCLPAHPRRYSRAPRGKLESAVSLSLLPSGGIDSTYPYGVGVGAEGNQRLCVCLNYALEFTWLWQGHWQYARRLP